MNSPYQVSSSPRPGAGDACSCCLRPWSECFPETGGFDMRRRQQICPPCHQHGANMLKASRAHAELWRALARLQQRRHDLTETQLREQLAEMEKELRDRPTQTVDRWIGLDELEEAHAEKQRAFRSRTNAWQALCEIRLLHREVQAGQCRCGLRIDRCKIAQIVEHYPALEKWEREQLGRLRGGLEHSLPDNHPGVLDRNWQP